MTAKKLNKSRLECAKEIDIKKCTAEIAFTRRQLQYIAAIGFALLLGIVLCPKPSLISVSALITVYYLFATLDKLYLIYHGSKGGGTVAVSDEEALSFPESHLPYYLVLLPVYGEPAIARTLVKGVGQLNYPPHKITILLLLEADDLETIEAFNETDLEGITPVLVPPGLPRTKPKACNYGMSLDISESEIITIYDAEDVPDPLQLRKVAVAFSKEEADIACFQARLGYYNETQNILTKWFTLEYDQWFKFMLPALSKNNCVIPLGGTSNHIKTAVWKEVGGWDSFNVTEDADLGVRIARHNYRTKMLDSTTLEEANSDPINWLRQRSRWYKGYMQTFFVHSRSPLDVFRSLGLIATVRALNITIGVPMCNMINLVFWAGVVFWFAGQPVIMENIFPNFLYYTNLFLFTVCNVVMLVIGMLSTRASEKSYLLWAALTIPFYWVLQGVASIKGLWQLVFRASYWEKTVHGLADDKER